MKQQGVKAVVFDFDCTISIKHSGGRVRAEKLDAFLQDNISPCFQQVGKFASFHSPHRPSNCESTHRVAGRFDGGEEGCFFVVAGFTVDGITIGTFSWPASLKTDEHISLQLLPKLLASDMKIGVATFADAHKSPATHGLHLDLPPHVQSNTDPLPNQSSFAAFHRVDERGQLSHATAPSAPSAQLPQPTHSEIHTAASVDCEHMPTLLSLLDESDLIHRSRRALSMHPI